MEVYDMERQFYNGVTEREEVWLFKENNKWFVQDIDSKGFCENHINYDEALKDYNKRIKKYDQLSSKEKFIDK